MIVAAGLLAAAALVIAVAPAGPTAAYLFGIPVEFILFGLMLVGVALLHEHAPMSSMSGSSSPTCCCC